MNFTNFFISSQNKIHEEISPIKYIEDLESIKKKKKKISNIISSTLIYPFINDKLRGGNTMSKLSNNIKTIRENVN